MTQSNLYDKLRPPSQTPADEICLCEGSTPLKLMYALSYNPLHCMVCNLEVAPDSLALDARLIDAIVGWRNMFGAIYHLWLDSGHYEEWARQQLTDIKNPVNERGDCAL